MADEYKETAEAAADLWLQAFEDLVGLPVGVLHSRSSEGSIG